METMNAVASIACAIYQNKSSESIILQVVRYFAELGNHVILLASVEVTCLCNNQPRLDLAVPFENASGSHVRCSRREYTADSGYRKSQGDCSRRIR